MDTFLAVNLIILWLMVLLNLILTLALVKKVNREGNERSIESGLKPGTKAPDFTGRTLDEKTVTLADFKGKRFTLLFISPHCSPCKEKLPEYERLHAQSRKHGDELLLVSIFGTPEDVEAMVSEYKLTIPVLLAPSDSNAFANDYKVNGTPSYCVINEQVLVESSGHPFSVEGGEWKKLVDKWESVVDNNTLIVETKHF